MSFDFDADQIMIMSDVRRLLEKHAPLAAARAVLEQDVPFSREAWRVLADDGWLSAAFPEALGGLGLGPKTLCAISQELGRALVAAPVTSSIYLAAQAILLFGSEEQKAAFIPALARGERIATLAICEEAGPLAPESIGTSIKEGRLEGTKIAVGDASVADLFIVIARSPENVIGMYIVERTSEGIEIAETESMDPTCRQGTVRFSGTPAEALDGASDGWASIECVLERAAVFLAFEQLGGAEACLQHAVAYAKERYAFGRPIGSYQAVKHRLADIYVEVELARAHAHAAAQALEDQSTGLGTLAAAARVSACRAFEVAARDMIQTFAGIAIAWEHEANLFYRRALQRELVLGSARQWVRKLGERIEGGAQAQGSAGTELHESAEVAGFRETARGWLAENAPKVTPPPSADDHELAAIIRQWLRMKADAGYVGFNTLAEYGGRGTGWVERIAFEQEEIRYPIAKLPVNFGRGNFVYMIQAHGSPEQQAHYLPPTLNGEIFWCQMFSEPSAGNDVAALRTRAVREGDGWRINGQKTWITGAHVADMGMLVVRTDPTVPKHKGMSFLLVDMRSPGVEVRPLKQMSGRSDFNEVFFTDVYVPDSNMVGKEGDGWKIVLTTLMAERPNAISSGGSAWGGKLLDEIIRVAQRTQGVSGMRAIKETDVTDKIVRYYLTLSGIERLVGKMTTALAQGGVPGPEGTIAKFVWTRAMQEMSRFALELLGPSGLIVDPSNPDHALIQNRYFGSAGYRQAGGTDDISKSIIAERVLGLPGDPRVDKDIPFNQIPVGL